MNRKSLRKSVSAAIGGVVLVTGLLVGAAFALAQDTDEPQTTDESLVDGGAFRDQVDLWDDNLADVLDEIREDALNTIDRAVADGKLTEEQGSAIRERIEHFDLSGFPFGAWDFDFGDREDGFPFGSHDFFRMPREGFEFDGDHFGFNLPDGFDLGDFDLGDFDFMSELEEFAERLGTTVDELQEKFESGMTLDEILEDLDLDTTSLAAEALEQALDKIDELVADGILTQERADSIKEMLERFELGEGLPFGLRDFQFDFDFNMDDLRDFHDHGRGFGFFGDDSQVGEESVAEALLNI